MTYLEFRGKRVATGWPATVIAIGIGAVLFTALIGVGFTCVYGLLTYIYRVLS